MTTQPTRSDYWPAILLAVLALCPGQINFTALANLYPTIAQNLGVSPADVSWAELLGNAALPLGYLVCLDLCKRISLRRLDIGALGLVTASSLCCALAPNLPVLVGARMVQGFGYGVLSLAIIPPLLTNYPPSRMPTTIAALVLGLFGAGTLGPVVGGFIEQMGIWRVHFTLNALMALMALVMAAAVVREQPAPNPRARFDGVALLLAHIGVLLVFIGIGQLSWHNWDRPQVYLPVVLGVVAFVALFAVELAQPDPLLTVRYLLASRPSSAAVACCFATVGYVGLLDLLPQFLQQVRGLGSQAAGGLLWPIFAGALVGAVLSGLAFAKPKWFMVLAVSGCFLLAVAAAPLTGLTAFTGDGNIMLVAFILGLGASVSIAPAMLYASLTVPEANLESTLALVTLLRESLQGAAGTALAHFNDTQQVIHYAHLVWQQASNLIGASSTQATNTSTQLLMNYALVLGMNDVARVVMMIVVLGSVVAVMILLMGQRASARSVNEAA